MVQAAEVAGNFEYSLVVKLRPDLTWSPGSLNSASALSAWPHAPNPNSLQVVCENDRICWWPKNVLPVLQRFANNVNCGQCPNLYNSAPSCLCLLGKYLEQHRVKFVETKNLQKSSAIPPSIIIRDKNAEKIMAWCTGQQASNLRGALRRCHGITMKQLESKISARHFGELEGALYADTQRPESESAAHNGPSSIASLNVSGTRRPVISESAPVAMTRASPLSGSASGDSSLLSRAQLQNSLFHVGGGSIHCQIAVCFVGMFIRSGHVAKHISETLAPGAAIQQGHHAFVATSTLRDESIERTPNAATAHGGSTDSREVDPAGLCNELLEAGFKDCSVSTTEYSTQQFMDYTQGYPLRTPKGRGKGLIFPHRVASFAWTISRVISMVLRQEVEQGYHFKFIFVTRLDLLDSITIADKGALRSVYSSHPGDCSVYGRRRSRPWVFEDRFFGGNRSIMVQLSTLFRDFKTYAPNEPALRPETMLMAFFKDKSRHCELKHALIEPTVSQ